MTLAGLAVAAMVATGGCSVVDVISNLGEPSTPGHKKTEKAATVDPAAGGGETNARAKLRAYYERERQSSSKKPEDPDNPIVRCKAQGQTQFLRKYDCELRGGRVLS